VEISEPHWHQAEVGDLLDRGRFDRVLSSVHAGPVAGGACEVSVLFEQGGAGDVVREYLGEVTRMIEAVKVGVLAHIDYAARYWPADAGPYDPAEFEIEHRRALSALAKTGGALEINTRLPLDARIVAWWAQEGGRAVTFGSDSHAPDTVAAGLSEAAKVAATLGFAPSTHLADPWERTRS
jgi:histidinol-phosphatase (PHP family)